MKKTRKQPKTLKLAKMFFWLVVVLGIPTFYWLSSQQTSINYTCQKLEKQIDVVESDIEGLTMQKNELTSFAKLEGVASEKGYTYKQGTATAAVGARDN